MNRNIELEAAETLLDAGISLPLLRLRLPFCRERVLRIVMRRPYWGTQMRIARLYLRQGIGAQKLAAMTEEEERRFFEEHPTELSQMVALTICRGYLSGLILAPVVAFLVRWRVPREYLVEAQRRFSRLRATRDFRNIIIWAEQTNPFRPGVSHRRSGS
ncbi:hypothetical protein [uncultured Alistipes sp.]|uniref:hypothetical protein n=1 Tax=uncultured Alistipes sp. TaxID=538949 RepID=UPI00261D3E14|nr:hypothetical protein [uncultured Alistipes sp.]